jgi:hypothetical protein
VPHHQRMGSSLPRCSFRYGQLAFRRPFAWSTLFNNGGGALRGQMNAAIKRHDLFDGGLAEFDVVRRLCQISLDSEPSRISIFLLQCEDGVNCADINFPPCPVRRAGKVEQLGLPVVRLRRGLARTAQPLHDGVTIDAE